MEEKTGPYSFKSISIIIPVYNEEPTLASLWSRLVKVVEELRQRGLRVQVIFIDDGSKDTSLEILKGFASGDEDTYILELARNYGQHPAIFAGFEQSQGEVVVTLDADLQNPPEEIPKLLGAVEEGYDVVGGWRQSRQDSLFRKTASKIINRFTSRMIGVDLKDYGCMLRAYRHNVIDHMLKCPEISSFIPALANTFTKRVCEIPVEHSERFEGTSKYSFLKLINLQFDLVTSFSVLPLKFTTYLGALLAFLGLSFGLFLMIMRFVMGSGWALEGVFTLFAILFFFVGMQFVAIGVMGEYVGRIYNEVRRRPRFVIKEIFTQKNAPPHAPLPSGPNCE